MLGTEQHGNGNREGEARADTALIDGIRGYVMDVRELDSDLIDRINPFEASLMRCWRRQWTKNVANRSDEHSA